MLDADYLYCPIRGQLNVRERAKDGLRFTEEKCRIDSIRYLLGKGYPRDNFSIETTLLQLGHKGRNSFRVDFSIYDEPCREVGRLPVAERASRIKLVGEVKRDNATATAAKAQQVLPAIKLLDDFEAFGVYWDDVEQRFFYRTMDKKKSIIHEAPISKIPRWGQSVASTQLTYADLETPKELLKLFDQIEIELHPHVADKAKRYAILLQLLLVKIHDENRHIRSPTDLLDLQDLSEEAIADKAVAVRMNAMLGKALQHYQHHLPEPIGEKFLAPPEALRRATKILAPVNLLRSQKEVIQAFYMKFAKNLYKWDLAQYFTPNEVIDFIVDITNPQYGEHIKDPACGSADFLVSAFREGRNQSPEFAECIWGADNSDQAVQVSVLNMLLNGDGKTNIVKEDSLEVYGPQSSSFDVVLCNPPFGVKIVEKRFEVLRKFDMGYSWKVDGDGVLQRTDDPLDKQETGILFAELCVRTVKPGGRVGLILPNGYLGNAGNNYLALREWLLRHTRVAGVVGFPRFTFKKSGADVSASVVFLERRETPLVRAADSDDYRFFVGMVENVGWRAGDKLGVVMHKRNQETGALILDEANNPVVESDFEQMTAQFLRCAAGDRFAWLREGKGVDFGRAQGWSVRMRSVARSPRKILDPKRLCEKFVRLQDRIRAVEHFKLGDVLEEVRSPRQKKEASSIFHYVEIQNIDIGAYDYEEVRGWALPSRAQLRAAPGDIFVASIWSSAGKWFMAGGDTKDLIVTNGCTRLRVKEGCEDYLPDIVAGLSSEAFRVQMRGYSTGSDGLAEISAVDLLSIVLPRIVDAAAREQMNDVVKRLKRAEVTLQRTVGIACGPLPHWPKVATRKDHWILV